MSHSEIVIVSLSCKTVVARWNNNMTAGKTDTTKTTKVKKSLRQVSVYKMCRVSAFFATKEGQNQVPLDWCKLIFKGHKYGNHVLNGYGFIYLLLLLN